VVKKGEEVEVKLAVGSWSSSSAKASADRLDIQFLELPMFKLTENRPGQPVLSGVEGLTLGREKNEVRGRKKNNILR